MEEGLFIKSYVPLMMRIIRKFEEQESVRLSEIIKHPDYTKIQFVKHGIDKLQEAKMLLHEFPGCPHCFEFDCESDHK